MADIRRCKRCGNLLLSDAPEGICPACTRCSTALRSTSCLIRSACLVQ